MQSGLQSLGVLYAQGVARACIHPVQNGQRSEEEDESDADGTSANKNILDNLPTHPATHNRQDS
ncbi:hypothetical protein AS156_31145 [Bradyrhizobium macuxiense]|uniref:Uncharacterized protein n=1 Tax=Bradyrhizobium macuxiense TaxID=1755647 RepID=A0A120FR33_9BRAD|nr:hypothetical protein [Bradyrhizobium macuxiense]KWV59492.1 hypothetical protein AS156_31145 [Bradyrhizobium macuxiense]